MAEQKQHKLFNPFPGLRPFGEDEGHFFFGREGQSTKALELLLQNKFVAVTGASGSGKSSLIYCGLIPALYGNITNESPDWKILTTRPGNSPIKNLSDSLETLNPQHTSSPWISGHIINTILNYSSYGLTEAVKQLHLKNSNLLLIIDQFEEIFRYKETRELSTVKSETVSFFQLLVKAIQSPLPIYIIITIRSDFIGECSAYTEFTRLINQSSFLIPKMTREDYRKAIEGPIAVAGANIEPQLTERILNTINDNTDQLPIMQHALMRTWTFWERKKKPETPITTSDYDSAGTLERAISLHANEAYNQLTPELKHICKRMFQTLTVKGEGNRGIRQPAKVKDVAEICNCSHTEIIEVVEVFRQKERSFLTPDTNITLTPNTVIDLSHESLMRVWDKLRTWVNEEVNSVQMYMRLVEASELYQVGKGGLWKPPDLHLAINWRKTQQPNLAWARKHHPAFERVKVFLELSERQFMKEESHKVKLQRRALKRSRMFALILGFFAFMFMGIMFYAFNQKSQADEARLIAEELRAQAEGQKDQEIIKRQKIEHLAILTADSLEKQKIETQEKSIIYEQEIQNVLEDVSEVIKEKEQIEEISAQTQKEKEVLEKTAKELQITAKKAEQEKQENYKKRVLSIAQNLSIKAQQTSNTNLKALMAYQSFIFNKRYNGQQHNPDIYNALYDALVNLRGEDFNGLEGHNGAVRGIKFVPGTLLLYSIGTDGKINYWNLDKSKNATLLYRNNFINRSLDISPDGELLAVGNDQANIQLFNLQSGKSSPTQLSKHAGWVWAVAFSPDSRTLVSTGADMKVIVWNLGNNNSRVLAEHNTRIRSIIFQDQNDVFYTGDDNGVLIQWRMDGSQKVIYQNPIGIYTLENHPQRNLITFGDKAGNIKIIHTGTNKLVANMNAHSARVFDIAYNSDATYMASSSLDGTIKLWETNDLSQRPITITKHESWVMSIAFSPDGKQLVSSSNKGDLVFIWPTSAASLANEMCKYMQRNFSDDEWNTYIGPDIPYEQTCNTLK